MFREATPQEVELAQKQVHLAEFLGIFQKFTDQILPGKIVNYFKFRIEDDNYDDENYYKAISQEASLKLGFVSGERGDLYDLLMPDEEDEAIYDLMYDLRKNKDWDKYPNGVYEYTPNEPLKLYVEIDS